MEGTHPQTLELLALLGARPTDILLLTSCLYQLVPELIRHLERAVTLICESGDDLNFTRTHALDLFVETAHLGLEAHVGRRIVLTRAARQLSWRAI